MLGAEYAMSGRALEWAMQQEASATEKLVLAALATFHSSKNERPFPSLSTLAKTASLDEKTVRRTLPKLESLGLIRINRSSGRRSHRYELLLKPGHAAQVNPDTLPMFDDEQPGHSDPQPGLSVPPTRAESPTNKVFNKGKNKKEAQLRFERFYGAYPKKKDRGRAEKAFTKLKPDDQLLEIMLTALQNQTVEREWKTQAGQFVPEWKYAATWLNGQCWTDEVDEQRPGKGEAYQTDSDPYKLATPQGTHQ